LVTSNAITMKVNATSTSTTNQTICPEALPYTWNGNNYSGAGTYTTHLTNAADCDSVATLMLTVTTPTSTTQASICQGQNYTFNETSYNTVGTYSVHIPTSNGCDSLAILQLKVNQPTTSTTNASICQGDNYTFNSTPYNATGTYIAHLINSNGCDSTATLHLTMNITKQTTINEEICSNETYSFGIKTLNQSGTYTETLSSSASCDSTVTLHLTVKPAYEQTREIRLVYGEKDTIEGKIYDEPGTFTETHTAVNGCDSTIITTVTLVKTHCPQVVIPAFFSPNGDGVDDIWQIENLSCYSASVDIYDRYGKRVAHYSGTDSGWDGTYLGHTEPSADYWYVIVLHDIDEKRVGHFTLKR